MLASGMLVAQTPNATNTQTIGKFLKLSKVPSGLETDNVLVRGTDGIVKFVPRSSIGGGSQVNADWLATSGVAMILNKPTIVGEDISGANYIIVKGKGTPSENGLEFSSKYILAKNMSPNGSVKSANNRVKIIVFPGEYSFSGDIEFDTEFVDIISITNNADIIIKSTGNCIVSANDVYIKGINTLTKALYTINSTNSLLKLENCEGGDGSFGNGSGTYTNCIGGIGSFAGNGGIASGTFINCIAKAYSFGGNTGSGNGTASGKFINCESKGDFSFGKRTVSGTFINCKSGSYSFGQSGGTPNGETVSGTFTNCTAGGFSFGGNGNCTASGVFTNCTAGDYSFGGYNGIASGTFIECVGGLQSFAGESSGVLSGRLIRCSLTSGTFRTVSAQGKTRFCLNADFSINTQN